jgi:hypothetical protein
MIINVDTKKRQTKSVDKQNRNKNKVSKSAEADITTHKGGK